MGLWNVFPTSKSHHNPSGAVGLASPRDRLAAFFLDVSLLVPLVQLLQAPIKRWVLESILFDEGSEAFFFNSLNLLMLILLFVAYDTIMTVWRGQTIGKIFFGIKVVSYHGQMGLLNALTRSFSIVTEFALLGAPFFAVMSHPLRRPIHDRIADTLVISLKDPVSFPGQSERIKAGLLMTSLYSVFALVLFISSLFAFVEKEASSGLFVMQGECDQVAEVAGDNSESLVEMYMTKQLDQPCFYKHVRRSLWVNDSDPNAYFAMSMATLSEAERSNEYLDKVCELPFEGGVCAYSLLLKAAHETGSYDLAGLKELHQQYELPDYLHIMSAGIFREAGDYKNMALALEPVSSDGFLQPVVAIHNFQALLGQWRWEEASWIYRTHPMVNDDELLNQALFEYERGAWGVTEQIQLLEFFHPSLKGNAEGRGLASAAAIDVPENIVEHHLQLKAER